MASIYSQIEETIKKAQEELQHLNNERNELRKAEKDIPRASYITEDASIRDHISRQQQIIDQNERILDAYNKARELILNRAALEDELRKARDDQDRQEIRQEMDAKEQELAAHRALMSPELQEELRQSILNQNQNTNEQNNENVEEITNEQPQQEQPQVEETQTQESQIIDNTEEIERLQSELEDAKRLVKLLKGMICHVNLIPINKIENGAFVKSSNENILKFRDYLNEHGIVATIRRELGSDIDAACGQLRRKNL